MKGALLKGSSGCPSKSYGDSGSWLKGEAASSHSSLLELRCAHFHYVRQKQEGKGLHYHANRVLFLRVGGVPHHHQRELHFIKKAYMTKISSSSVSPQCEDLMLASSKPVHDDGLKASIHEFVHETARQSLLLASNAAEAGRASGENAEKESDVGTSNIAAVVYTRRCRRNLVANRVSAVTDNLNTELKDSVFMAEDVPLQGQIEEAAIKLSGKVFRRRKKEEVVPQHTEEPGMAAGSQIMSNTSQFTEKETGKISRKRTVTAKTSQTADLEEATASHKRKVIAKTSQCKEVETGTGSNDRKVNARASHHTKADIGSQQINATEAAFQNVELEVHSCERPDRDKKVDPWLSLVHKKVQAEWCVYNPVTMRRANPPNNSLKLLSWNVNGIRALLKGKGDQQPGTAILKLAEKEDFDVLCLQETKLQEKDILTIKEALLPGYDNSLWSCSTAKLGYSGTAVISRINPLSVAYGLGIPYHDREGRIITVEFDKFFLVTSYVPNSGQKLERLAYRTQDWDLSLANFLKNLEKSKPVILTGDLNCAHQEIDIYNPDGNRRSAGFTDEERASFERNFLERGLNDTFRRQHPNTVAYTYWGYRTAARPKNQGWRLDYFLASDALLDLVHDSYTLPDVGGSDHCPIGLTLKC